jgi:hypothetical protein
MAMSSIIKENNASAILRQRLHPLGKKPVYRVSGRKPVNQYDWLVPVRIKRLEIKVGNRHAIREKLFHFDSLLHYIHLKQFRIYASALLDKIEGL